MASETVRIKAETHSKLRGMSEQSGQPMSELLEQAVEALRRQKLLEATNAAYAALKDDPKAWEDELEERALWESTLADGLEPRK